MLIESYIERMLTKLNPEIQKAGHQRIQMLMSDYKRDFFNMVKSVRVTPEKEYSPTWDGTVDKLEDLINNFLFRCYRLKFPYATIDVITAELDVYLDQLDTYYNDIDKDLRVSKEDRHTVRALSVATFMSTHFNEELTVIRDLKNSLERDKRYRRVSNSADNDHNLKININQNIFRIFAYATLICKEFPQPKPEQRFLLDVYDFTTALQLAEKFNLNMGDN